MRLNIEGEGLSLRPFSLSDAAQVSDMSSDYDVAKMLGRVPYPNPVKDVEAWIETHNDLRSTLREFPFAIVHWDRGLVGRSGVVTLEVSMRLDTGLGRAHWGFGIATKAARIVSAWAESELDIQRLMAGHYIDNPSSGRVLEKAGYNFTGATESRYSQARAERVTTRIYLRERAKAAA